MVKYAIIADDLTGGMDSGIQAVKAGLTATLVINEKKLSKMIEDTDVIVMNTASRGYSQKKAYKSIKKAAKSLNQKKIKLLYKKIDSTIRGNIGAELDAVLDNIDIDMILVNPAMPKAGRKVVNGELFLDGKKITETKFKDDIIAPVKYSYIPYVIEAQTKKEVGLLTWPEIQKGTLVKRIESCYENGIEILVSDAYTDEHLLDTAAAIKKSKLNIVACGSAGLLEAYFSLHNKPNNKGKIETKKGRMFVVTTSLNEITKQQIKFAHKNLKTKVVKLDTRKMHKRSERKRLIKKIEQILNEDEDVILNTDGYQFSKPAKVVSSVAEILYRIKTDNLAGVMIIGGDTAIGCCKTIKAAGIQMIDELEPYVPIGKIIGGKYDEMPIITKAGGLGEEDIIVKAIKYFGGN